MKTENIRSRREKLKIKEQKNVYDKNNIYSAIRTLFFYFLTFAFLLSPFDLHL
jgi:hypothetical protein